MAHNILVVTPQAAFGELIRLTLEETSLYRVRLVQTAAAALSSCDHIPFSLAILDTLENEPLAQLQQKLRAALPGLKVMVIPPANNPNHPLLAGVAPEGFIFQPFYVPDMLDAVNALLEKPEPQQALPQDSAPLPTWVSDPSETRRLLEQHLPQTSAHSALLILTRQRWVQAGMLGESAAQEVVHSLARASNENATDLARFIRLNGDGSEQLVYAVPLPGSVLLALAFAPYTSLSKISAQTHQVARQLTRFPAADVEEILQGQPPVAIETPAPQPISVPKPAAELALEEMLSQFPSPEPTPEAQGEARFLFPWEIEAGRLQPPTNTPPPALPVPEETSRTRKNLLDTIPLSPQERVEATRPSPVSSLEDTQPARAGKLTPPPTTRATDSVMAELVYTCILLPRLPEAALSGDLAARLTEWLPQLCAAFGWQLEGLVIQRQYLQWSVQVTPTISPGNVVRAIRQHTSQRIAQEFPRYQLSSLDGDFWAPGFLILSGSEPPSPVVVANYIQQTRQRQAGSAPRQPL